MSKTRGYTPTNEFLPRDTQGERIAKARRQRGRRADWMASMLRVTKEHYSRMENDRATTTLESVKEIARLLDVPFDALYRPHRQEERAPMLTLDQVLMSDRLIERFLDVPAKTLKAEHLSWVRQSLSVIQDFLQVRIHAMSPASTLPFDAPVQTDSQDGSRPLAP